MEGNWNDTTGAIQWFGALSRYRNRMKNRGCVGCCWGVTMGQWEFQKAVHGLAEQYMSRGEPQ